MKPEERVITFPIMSKAYTEVMKEGLEKLGLKVLLPPPITDKTVKLGVKYSPNMMCLPFKVCLGNYIEALEMGANTLLSYDTQGICRFKQYNHLHEFVLKCNGYKFEMIAPNPKNITSTLCELSGKSKVKVIKTLLEVSQKVNQIDKPYAGLSKTLPNIGIIGEIYCCCEETVNLHLEDKIIKYGCHPFNTARAGTFMNNKIFILKLFTMFKKDLMKAYKKDALQFFNGHLGGHSYENMYNLLWMIDNKIDGVIHIAPLSCMPDSTIEPYIDKLCKENSIPLLRIPLDENTAEANMDTRVETFCELIKIRRAENEKSISRD